MSDISLLQQHKMNNTGAAKPSQQTQLLQQQAAPVQCYWDMKCVFAANYYHVHQAQRC
jgi:hypothetical protein